MKKNIMIALLIAAIFAMALPFAVSADDGNPGNSTPGIDRYLDNPGGFHNGHGQCETGAISATKGYLGKDLNMGIKSDPNDPGANGYQTGLNNSAVCGNRP